MTNSKDKFLKRMFLYNLQYLASAIASVMMWYAIFVLFCYLDYKNKSDISRYFGEGMICTAPILIFSFFNTITYFYSKKMAERYGIEMFADLDQDWLREHQAFDSKAFGEIFARLIQCRKIAGPYMLAVIVPLAFINMYLAFGVGVVYVIAYFFYRETYLDTAISYKIPRAFGNSIVVSKVLGDEESKSKER